MKDERLAYLAEAYSTGTLTQTERKELEEALKKDPSLAAILKDQVTTDQALRVVLDETGGNTAVKQSVLSSLEGQPEKKLKESILSDIKSQKKTGRRRKRSFAKRFMPMGLAAAAVLLLAAGASFFYLGTLLPWTSAPAADVTAKGEGLEVIRDGAAVTDTRILNGDILRTGAGSETRLTLFRETTAIHVNGKSEFTIKRSPGGTLVSVVYGNLTFTVAKQGRGRTFRAVTGQAEVLVKGTVFSVDAQGGMTTVSVSTGVVEVKDPLTGKTADLKAGMYTVADGKSELKPRELPEVWSGPVMPVRFSVDFQKDRHPINPMVYGANVRIEDNFYPLVEEVTTHRYARIEDSPYNFTTYNWDLNTMNSGRLHGNRNFTADPKFYPGYKGVPGGLVKYIIDRSARENKTLFLTVPMFPMVSADGDGEIEELEGRVRTNDPAYRKYVTSEMIQLLKSTYKGKRYIALDSQPAVWDSNFPAYKPEKLTYAEMLRLSIETAGIILDEDPEAQVIGGNLCCWEAHLTLCLIEKAREINKQFGNFTNYFLDGMRKASEKQNRRLLHMYNLYLHPALNMGKMSKEEKQAASMQQVRALWDPEYKDDSWLVRDILFEPLNAIPRLQQSIDSYYPGTQLVVGRYGYGDAKHISGGICQADLLGVFTRFNTPAFYQNIGKREDHAYVQAGFNMYLNYNGKGGQFGDTSVSSSTEDKKISSIHASVDKDGGKAVIVCLNRDFAKALSSEISLKNLPGKPGKVALYRFDKDTSSVYNVPEKPEISEGALKLLLPPLSATLIEIRFGK